MSVDVIIPVYNGAAFVARAIESVLAQSVDAVTKIVCVDDGSSDDSVAVLNAVAARDPRIRVVRNETNVGVAESRNRGVRETCGDLIAFLDHDDEWMPDKLERQITALTNDVALGFVIGRQRLVLDADMAEPAWSRPHWFTDELSASVPSALLVRREAMNRVGPFDSRYRAGSDDADWFARARRLGVRWEELDAVVVVRHVHDANQSANPLNESELLDIVRRHARARSLRETS